MSPSEDDSMTRLDDILTSLPTGVLLVHDGIVTYANRAARRLLGEHVSEGTPAIDLGSDGLTDALTETAESGRSLRLDIPHDDRQVAVRTNIASDGAVVAVLTDVTDVRRVETLRRDFVTNASHELKTPVAGIQALAESLQLALERSPERAHSMVERLQVEAQRLNQLVRELLDLARLEDTDDVPRERLQRVDLAEIAAVQADRVAPRAELLGVEVHVDAPEPAVLVGSAADLRLIVGNVIENAVDYNVTGGRVDVRVRRQGATVLLEVSDTGIGIPADQVERVFERFYRVDKARSRLAGGTGLGLSITRHAVESLNGTITVDSEVGRGTTFRVELPVAPD